ncbi:SixA phosphatase family protein [Planctomycetaceae bacterium SH139]
MRHAKSDWNDAAATDHDRTLNDRGRRDAPRMATWLLQQTELPELILASTAVRVSQTLDLLMTSWPSQPPVHPLESLYLAAPETILRTLQTDTLGLSRVMIVAHNPGLQMLANQLAGEHFDFPTAAIAIFDFDDIDWTQLSHSTPARLSAFGTPKGIATS